MDAKNIIAKRVAQEFDVVIAEAENIFDEPLDPDMVHTPGILVKYLVQG